MWSAADAAEPPVTALLPSRPVMPCGQPTGLPPGGDTSERPFLAGAPSARSGDALGIDARPSARARGPRARVRGPRDRRARAAFGDDDDVRLPLGRERAADPPAAGSRTGHLRRGPARGSPRGAGHALRLRP